MRRSSPSQHPAESPPASFRAESDANTALRSLQLRSPQPSPPTTPSKRTSSQASLRRSESISNNPALASSRRGSSEEQQLQQGELPATSSSSPTAPASLKATTTATANTAAVTPAGEQATSTRNDSRRKSRSRERDVEEDTYSAHQRRLYRPEVRSCGHPQPIVLKVPVGQGSPDLLVSPSLASQLTTSTTAASLMTTPELSPKKSAAAIHARPPSAPASPSAKTSVSPSVLSSAITNAESIAATTVLNAAARSPPYAAESARVSNATESLAEQPLCPPTALPTTPPSSSVSVVAKDDGEDVQMQQHQQQQQQQALLPSSSGVTRRFQYLRAISSSSSSSSCSSLLENSLLWPPRPSETERTVDVDPTLTEPTQPQPRSSQGSQPTPQMSDFVVPTSTSLRRVVSSDDDVERAEEEDDVTIPFSSAHDHISRSAGQTAAEDAEALRSSTTGRRSSTSTPHSQHGDRTTGGNSSSGSQRQSGVNVNDRSQQHVQQADESKQHQNDARDQPETDAGGEMRLTDVEELSDRDVVEAEEDEHEEGEEEDGGSHNSHSSSTHDEGVDSVDEAQLRVAAASADPRSDETAPPTRQSQVEKEEEAEAAAAIPSAAAATPAAALPAVVVAESAIDDASLHLVSRDEVAAASTSVDEGSHMSVPSSNVFSGISTSNRTAVHPNLPAVLTLTSPASLGAASLFIPSNPQLAVPLSRQQQLHTVALQSAYTIHHSTTEEGSLGVAPVSDFEPGRFGAVKDELLSNYATHHSTEDTLGIGDGGGGGDGGDGGGCGHCMGPETSSLPRDAFDALDVIGQPTRTMEHAREVVEIALKPEADEAADVKKGSSGSAGQEASVASLQKDPTPGTAGAAAVEREQSEAAAAPAVETAAASGKGTESTESSPHQVAEAEENSKKSHEHARSSSDVEAVDVERAVPHDDFSEHQQRAPPRQPQPQPQPLLQPPPPQEVLRSGNHTLDLLFPASTPEGATSTAASNANGEKSDNNVAAPSDRAAALVEVPLMPMSDGPGQKGTPVLVSHPLAPQPEQWSADTKPAAFDEVVAAASSTQRSASSSSSSSPSMPAGTTQASAEAVVAAGASADPKNYADEVAEKEEKEKEGRRPNAVASGDPRAIHAGVAWRWPSHAATASAPTPGSPLDKLLSAVDTQALTRPEPPPPQQLRHQEAGSFPSPRRLLVAQDFLEDVEQLSDMEAQQEEAEGEGEAQWGGGQLDKAEAVGARNARRVSSYHTDLVGEYVQECRSAAAAADLAVVQELEREDRRRLLSAMLVERELIFREEAAAFTVVSFMTAVRGHERGKKTPHRNIIRTADENTSVHELPQQQPPRDARRRKKKALLPPSPPAPTSRQEVQELLRTRGLLRGGVSSLGLVSAAVFTDELLHREVIEDDEVRARTMLRRLRQCEMDALFPFSLFMQETLAWQRITEEEQMERQRVRALDVVVNEEMADLLNASRELAMCYAMEEEERVEVIERAEEAGRQRLYELHRSGLAARLRQRALLLTSLHLELADALEDLTFDESQAREELRVEAIREWTMLLESASGTAVLAHARAQQQRQERKRETHAHRGRHSRRAAQAPSSSSPPRDLHERQTDTHKKKKRQQEDQQLPSDAATMHVAVSPRDPVSSSAQLTAAGAAAEAAEAINEEEVEEVESMRHVDSSDTSPSSSESSTRSSSSSSSSVSISIESKLDDHHHHDRPGLDVAPVFFQWDPTSNSNPSPPQSSPLQRRQPHEHPPQPQLSSSSPSPHLTNMTTFTTTTGATTTTTTTTTTINTSSSSMLVGQQQGVARATVSSGATHASTVSRRSPTLVLPAKQRWATAQQTEDGIGPAEASALLHALHCAEEDTRQAKRAPSAAAAAAANLAKKKSREEKRAAEGDARRSRHNTADEGRREDSALYKAKQRAKTSEVVNERGDEVAATTRVADAAGAASGERARHDRRTSPASPRRSPLFITRHTIPCSLQRSPSHNYHALLRKYASPVDSSSSPPNRRGGKDPRRSSTAKLLLAAGARALMSPSFSPISPRPYDDREVYAYDPQRARRHTSSPRAGARVADKQLRVPWDHTTYTDSRFNAMADSHTPAEERNTNQQQLPHHRLLPGVDEKEQLPHEQTMAEVTAAGKASSASTLTMLTPAREVFPPHRTSTLDININNNNNNDMIQDIAADDQRSSTTSPAHPRPRTRGALLVSEYVPAERTPLTQQELAQPTVIEVITDTCVPSARDVSLSPLSSAVPSPPRPPLAYAAPTAAWTMQVEQRQQDRLRSMLRATQISSGNYATHVSNVLLNEEEKDEEGASMEPGGRSAGTQYDGESYFDTDSFTGDDACRHGRRRRLRSTEQLGCSRRRPQEPSGPLLITRLPFEQGPGVWPSAVNERARVSSPLRHCDNKDGGLAGPRSRGDQRGSKAVVNGITASPYSPHPVERHVILTTRPVSTSPSRLRTPPSPQQQQQQQPTSSATLVSALKDAFTTALRSGDVVQLPTTVAELLRGPQHAHITLPLTTQADNLTNWNNDNGRGADDDNDNDDDDAEARADGTDGGCLDENQVSKAKGEETRRWRASNRLLSPLSLGRSLHNGNNNNDDNFGASRSSYNYVDVFFKQPRRESPSPPMKGANGRQSCTSPPAARTASAVARAHQPPRTTVQQRFIAERCAAVQEREAQHGLRELLRPSLRTRQARSSNEAAAATLRPATLTADVSAAEGSSFIGKGVEDEPSFNNPRSFSSRTRRTHAELMNDDMQELDEAECFFDTADMVLCSALASQLKRERGTAQRRRDVRQQQQRQQQQQQQQKNVFLSRTSVKRHLEPHAARASLSVGSNSTHLQSLPQQRQQQQQRDASPSTASSFGLDIPASYRIMRAPSPSYLQLRMPSQPPQRTPGPFSTPLSASAAAVAAAAAAGAAPGHPAAGSTTSHGYAAASSPSAPLLNPYDTHILYFNTNGLSSRPVRTGAA